MNWSDIYPQPELIDENPDDTQNDEWIDYMIEKEFEEKPE